MIQLVGQLHQCKLEKLVQKQGECPYQFPDIEPGYCEDHIQHIAQAAAQLIAIHPMSALTISDPALRSSTLDRLKLALCITVEFGVGEFSKVAAEPTRPDPPSSQMA